MSVYVDELRVVAPSKAWPFATAAHMIADSLPELHAFARKIGLRRAWFQSKSFPHYDLHDRRHALALRYGATLVPGREIALIIRRIRREHAQATNEEQSP